MTGKPVADDKYFVLGRMTAKFMDLSRRVRDGSLPSDQVLAGLQSIIDGGTGSAYTRVPYIQGMFAGNRLQVDNIRRWNTRYGWEFSDEEIEAAAKSAPAWPDRKLASVQLVPYLDDHRDQDGNTIEWGVGRTFEALWNIAALRQQRHGERRKRHRHGEKYSWRSDLLISDESNLRLHAEIKHPGKCLRWEVIDLAANWDCHNGLAPNDVRNTRSPHAGVLAAAAHHPRWVRAMNGQNVPYVSAAGYECEGAPGWWGIPSLDFGEDGERVVLGLTPNEELQYCYAVPSLLVE